MNILNRREFKELLIEWRNNLINERGQYSSSFKKDIPCFLIGVEKKHVFSLVEYLYDNVSIVKKNIDDAGLVSVGGIAIEKSEDIIEEIFNYFNVKISLPVFFPKEEIKSSRTPLIIFPAYGNRKVDKSEKDEKDEYAWVTHDLEHALFGYGTPMVFNKELKEKLKSNYPDEANSVRLVSGTKSGYTQGPNNKDVSWKEKNIIQKFFNDPQISFTKGVGSLDIEASIWAYCIARIKDKEDLSSVDNSSLEDEEKDVVKEVLFHSYDKVMSGLETILRNIDNQIIIVRTFA